MQRTAGGTRRRFQAYQVLRSVHLWLSLIFAIPVFVLSLTGAVLVFGDELQSAVAPDAWTVSPRAERLSHGEILDRVRRQTPDVAVWSVSVAEELDRVWTMWLAEGAGVLNVDPYTGAVLAHYYPVETFRGWVTGLHRRWLAAGENARWIRHGVSAATLVLMIQVILGLWLWTMPRDRLQRLKVSGGLSPRLLVLRLHNLAGVLTALLVLLIAFTGMSMYWQAPAKAVVETVTASRITPPAKMDFGGLRPVRNLDAAMAKGFAAVPDGRLTSFRPPSHPGAPVVMNFERQDTFLPARAWVGDWPPRVLAKEEATRSTAAAFFWQMRYRLHVGQFGGWPVRAFWVLLSLMPAAFIITGLWLYWHRQRKHRR